MAKNENLLAAIATALEKLEQSGDIVVAAQSSQIAVHLYDAMKDSLPTVQLTAGECGAAGSLILHAVEDERFLIGRCPP